MSKFWNFLYTEEKKINKTNLFIFLLPIPISIMIILFKYHFLDGLDFFAQEDGVFENIQPIAYFAATFFAIKIAILKFKEKNKFQTVLYSLIALFLFFWAGEEISWGQRIFGIESSEHIREINIQGETTLHNIDGLHQWLDPGHMLVGLVGTLSCIFYPKIRKTEKLKPFLGILPKPKYLLYFLTLFIMYFLYLYIRPLEINWWITNLYIREQETVETFLSLAIFGTIFETWQNILDNKKPTFNSEINNQRYMISEKNKKYIVTLSTIITFVAVAVVLAYVVFIKEDDSQKSCSEINKDFGKKDFSDISQRDIECSSLKNEKIYGSDDNSQLETGTIILYQTSEDRYGKLEVTMLSEDKKTITAKVKTLNDEGRTYKYSQEFVLRPSYNYDLDEIKEVPHGEADFYWTQESDTVRYLYPVQDTKFIVYK